MRSEPISRGPRLRRCQGERLRSKELRQAGLEGELLSSGLAVRTGEAEYV